MTNNVDYTKYTETINGGKLTKDNVWKHIQNKEVEYVGAYDDAGNVSDADENVTAAKAYKTLCKDWSMDDCEKEDCSVTFFVKYEEYEETVYKMIDFTLV